MSEAALDSLILREEALVAALDGGDAGILEQAVLDLRDALAGVAATGGWRDTKEIGLRLIQALRLADAAGGRINYLLDDNRRRLDRIAVLAGQPRSGAYGRTGRLG